MSQQRETRWEYLHPQEFAEAVAACPVCYMPLGTLERHGSHLPFGLDALKAHGLCVRAAQKHGGVVLPPLHWGTHGWWAEEYRRGGEGTPPTNKQPAGSVYIHEGLLMNLLHAMFREVEYAGFRVIVALTGHYPEVQVAAVKHAAQQYMVESGVRIWALHEPELSGEVEEARRSKQGCGRVGPQPRSAAEVGRDHAGKWETSLMWAMHPELVKMERCPDPETGRFLWCPPEAREASRELGEKTVEYIVDRLGMGAAKLLSEAPGGGR